MPVGSASEPTWKTNIRRSVPSWVAARPTPIASRIRPIIRSASAARSSSNSVTGEAADLSTGSPNLMTSDRAAERRSSASWSTPSGSPASRGCSPSSSSTGVGVPSSAMLSSLVAPISLRINVDRDRDLAQGSITDGGPDGVPDRLHRAAAVLGLEEEAAPVLPAQSEERRRAEQIVGGAEAIGDELTDLLGRCLHAVLVLPGEPDLDQVGERWVSQSAPSLDLLGEKAGGVWCGGGADARRAGRERLDKDAAAGVAPAAAARELGDQREGALLG